MPVPKTRRTGRNARYKKPVKPPGMPVPKTRQTRRNPRSPHKQNRGEKMKKLLVQNKELTGKPGNIWNGVVVPGGGKTVFLIEDDLLVVKTVTAFGLEKKTVYTKLSDVGSIELCQGRLWWLIVFGITTLFFVVGIIFIVLFFFLKQKWITVRCRSVSLILFYNKQADAVAFKDTLLAEIMTGKERDKSASKKLPGARSKPTNLSKSDDLE